LRQEVSVSFVVFPMVKTIGGPFRGNLALAP